MKLLLIDNYDSFTYNLYQQIGTILKDTGQSFDFQIIRNDEYDLAWITAQKFDKIIVSPGPGNPADSHYFGVCAEVITRLSKDTPTLGVCLGMQGICHYFGGQVIKAKLPMHGKTSLLKHNNQGLFKDLPQDLEVMRYHSLIADPKSLPPELEITAWVGEKEADSYEIMGLKHISRPLCGIQFHPESFATEGGNQMLKNFLASS